MTKFRKCLAWLAVLLIIPMLTLGATTTAANASCNPAPSTVSGGQTGDNLSGSWTYNVYDPNCNGNYEGQVTVTWNTSLNIDGQRWVKYDMSLWVGNLPSGQCIQVALDYSTHMNATSHGDAQIMRNCYDHSTRDMGAQTIQLDKYCTNVRFTLCSTANWTINRMQLATYNPSGSDGNRVGNRVCPDSTGDDTTTYSGCTAWTPQAQWTATGAKIRRRTTSGVDEENLPLYSTGAYDVKSLTDPNN